MPQKILFSDIDGTLLNAERELSEKTIAEIQRIKDKMPVILISSRMPSAMYHLQKVLDIERQPIICYNGGLILVDRKPVLTTMIPVGTVKELYEFSLRNPFHISLYNEDDWHVPEMDFWATREMNNTKVTPKIQPIHHTINEWKVTHKGAHKIMCMGDPKVLDRVYDFLDKRFETELHLYRSKPTYIEIASSKISKLTAIEYLLENHFNDSIDNVVAFGDNYNDISMLTSVGMGVAVANAKPEVLKIADHITLSGKEDGVAKYIKDHL